MSINVSSSLKGEFSRIKELFPAIQAETRYKDFSINYEKLQNLYYNQFDENPIIKVFYALDGDELVGFGAFVITAHYFTDELIASDIIVYVRPERRGSSAAVKILKNYILWATQLFDFIDQFLAKTNDFLCAFDSIDAGELLDIGI